MHDCAFKRAPRNSARPPDFVERSLVGLPATPNLWLRASLPLRKRGHCATEGPRGRLLLLKCTPGGTLDGGP